MASMTAYIVILILGISYVQGNNGIPDVEQSARETLMLKYLMEMVNQSKVENQNLPANATSIRENITDTFSCENRPYGYYADVDNECQVFHVCFTMHSPSSGRNTTYQWSFICPKYTVFNQLALTCTYPKDSIKCEDSPQYYDLNLEIGKTPNDTETQTNSENMGNMDNSNDEKHHNKKHPVKKHSDAETIPGKHNRRNEHKNKQNLVMKKREEAKKHEDEKSSEGSETTIADTHYDNQDKSRSTHENNNNKIHTDEVKEANDKGDGEGRLVLERRKRNEK